VGERDGISLSLKMRDLLREAFEAEEERILARLAEERERSFDRGKALTRAQVWSHLDRPRR
jgi:hypothetical protein